MALKLCKNTVHSSNFMVVLYYNIKTEEKLYYEKT